MSFSLLATKLYIPPLREGAVARPHLIRKLLSGMNYPGSFALLSGPAGFGKTTLLSAFVAQLRQPLVWLSLDEGDNDPNRFWTYLITGCQSVLHEIGDTALTVLRAPQPLPDEAIPTLLINDLARQNQPLTLILDDFHHIHNESLMSSLLFLLDHLPHHLHLIISTRTDPPWPLARYRARNQLVEIRAQDLRFSVAEASEFLNQTMGLSLSREASTALEERTEGWVAGLQLAALSMQGRSDLNAFIQDFTGSHVFIAEYLVDEVLKRQPGEMQDFLLKTSILKRLNAQLCEAVTGCQEGQSKLKTLLQANIFIIPLDDSEGWFRYHHLFADLLMARLQSSMPQAAIGDLHRQAAHWYEQHQMSAEAIDHALAVRDDQLILRLMEENALPMILQARVRTVEHWLQSLPYKLIENSPRINMAYAWMNLLRGAQPKAMPFISRLETIFASPEAEGLDASIQAEWLCIQCELLMSQGRPDESRDLAIQAQAILPSVDPNIRSMLYITLGKAYQQTLDYDRAADIFKMIVIDARAIGDMTFEVLGASGQAQMVLKQGKLHQTYQIATEAIRRLEQSGKNVPFSATLYGELAQVYFSWYQCDQARRYFQLSMEISGKSGYSDPEIYFHLMLSKISQLEGDLDGSVREIQEATRLAGIIPPAMVRESLISQQVRINLALDKLASAEKLLEQEGFSFGETFESPAIAIKSPITHEAGLLYNSALRILLYKARKRSSFSNLKSGIGLAEQLLREELKCQLLPIALETLLLLIQMYAVSDDAHQSLVEAVRALELAEPEDFISAFIEEGNPVFDILTKLTKSNLPSESQHAFIRKILSAFPAQIPLKSEPEKAATENAQLSGIAPLVEPLTARELQVLRLIAEGDSNQAVAEKLVITVSAVKKHTGNIFGKLTVNSRTQAILRARQLGLLPTNE